MHKYNFQEEYSFSNINVSEKFTLITHPDKVTKNAIISFNINGNVYQYCILTNGILTVYSTISNGNPIEDLLDDLQRYSNFQVRLVYSRLYLKKTYSPKIFNTIWSDFVVIDDDCFLKYMRYNIESPCFVNTIKKHDIKISRFNKGNKFSEIREFRPKPKLNGQFYFDEIII